MYACAKCHKIGAKLYNLIVDVLFKDEYYTPDLLCKSCATQIAYDEGGFVIEFDDTSNTYHYTGAAVPKGTI